MRLNLTLVLVWFMQIDVVHAIYAKCEIILRLLLISLMSLKQKCVLMCSQTSG